jgi:uncharacterized protein (DUF1800 family)
MSVESWIFASKRFGYGPRPGDVARVGDPKEALLAEIAAAKTSLDDPALLPTAAYQAQVFADQAEKKMMREVGAQQMSRSALPSYLPIEIPVVPGLKPMTASTGTITVVSAMAPNPPATPTPAEKPPEPPEGRAYRAESLARLSRACTTDIGLTERVVAFWSNHFCVSIAKSNLVHVSAGSFEREAIRPYVYGRFADMLRAVEQHPAMLHFLDNQQSIGPDSKAGKNRKAGLNENLAREILELHTMGVGSGYTQADVTSLARAITGWTSVGAQGMLGEPGTFIFNANAHEPGPEAVLGKTYEQEGIGQGDAALEDIARQPATAAHIAHKFARSFVADEPDPKLVERLTKVFLDTKGDLAAVTRTLISSQEAWSAPATKLRTPWEFVVASYRAFGKDPSDPGPALNALRLLGQPLWRPEGPNGFSDEAAAWLSPEGMKMRVEIAAQYARQLKDAPAPMVVADAVLGPAASSDTKQAILRAETPEQAYALLLLSPEFQRR